MENNKFSFRFRSLLGAFILTVFWGNAIASVVYAKHMKVEELEVGNMLSWSTAEEVDSKYFVVQKSMEGMEFVTVGQVKAAGTTEENNNYRYLDLSTGENKMFYRLMQVDVDGSFSYSQTVLMTRNNENNFLITAMSSTITDRIFTLTLRSSVKDKLEYNFVDAKSNVVKEGSAEIVDGANMLAFDLLKVENGLLKLELKLNDEVEEVFIRKDEKSEMPHVNYVVKEN